ncbi:MAG: hypothetical protein JWR90_3071 [Marmoricola sp.]|nr:hypothetical protein [Marmoricola sp.]
MRFGRKSGSAGSADIPEGQESAPDTRVGPFDASDVDLDQHEGVDLGSLVIAPIGAMELQLQVDEGTGQVMAAVLVGENAALELRAFAASRGGGAWDELRPRIAAEMARQGGTTDEQQGTFGTELRCMVPIQTPDGKAATQASRVVAHEGPAWLLRATLMGAPALDPELAAPWEETIRQVVVRRGRDAMPPGAPLPLHLPPEARRVDPPAADTPAD